MTWKKAARGLSRRLRRTAVAGCAVFGVILGCTGPPGPDVLHGVWTGAGASIPFVEVQFFEDQTFRMRLVTEAGENLEYDGEYEIDLTKHPIPLTMRGMPQLPHAIHTIIEIRADETMRMGAFSEKWRLRPLDFNPATQMILSKKHADSESDG